VQEAGQLEGSHTEYQHKNQEDKKYPGLAITQSADYLLHQAYVYLIYYLLDGKVHTTCIVFKQFTGQGVHLSQIFTVMSPKCHQWWLSLLMKLLKGQTMCAYESEMMLFQLHLYARSRQPGLEFQAEKLKFLLDEWNITSMRQLFDLPAEAKIALVLPLMIPRPANTKDDMGTIMDSDTRIAGSTAAAA
jgi:hypothetical protein